MNCFDGIQKVLWSSICIFAEENDLKLLFHIQILSFFFILGVFTFEISLNNFNPFPDQSFRRENFPISFSRIVYWLTRVEVSQVI